ncbi:nitroreductase family protein [Caproiciproducens sp. CPB-2]|uniref:nitroreductase family protein n=1 Tax=Caproiciproducens sp. CPB-2 TaxID=3030017 RepID=UPI0023DB0F2B|nr:nitroreductase family protein [Caproiciproducens sp. CPB-2]MDF1495443.1 nitroreductase family protein [Caproiciproducens sp. CPB-2]
MEKNFLEALKKRRSYYAISKEKVLSDEEVVSLVEDAVKYTPSAFNSQSARTVVLFGKEHDKLWDITMEILRGIVPAKNFASTEEKINSFRGGYGTVLYFEDQSIVTGLQEQFPLYKDNFPVWSLESSGMLQFVIWTALESNGYGASLQHYNPLIDEKVAASWNIPKSWKLLAQMPFGKPTASPDEKTFLPLEDRVKIYR